MVEEAEEDEDDDAEFTYPEDKRCLSGSASTAAPGTSSQAPGLRESVRARVDRLNVTLEPRPLFPQAAISLR